MFQAGNPSVKQSLIAVYQTRYLGQDCSAMPGSGLVFRRLAGIVSPFKRPTLPPYLLSLFTSSFYHSDELKICPSLL